MLKFILLAAAATILVACGVNANNQTRAPKKDTPPEGSFMDIDGTTVHYVERGTGPTLILIHGAGGSSRDWTFSMMDKLTDRYRVIAVDRPGHGYTTRIKSRTNEAETLTEQSDLIYKLAQNLNVDKAIVAGQSYGGAVAVDLAVHHPDIMAGLVMISAVSNPWEGGLDDWYETTNTAWGKYILIPTLSFFATEQKANDIVKGTFAPDTVPAGYLDHMGLRLSTRVSQIRANTAQIYRSLGDINAIVGRYGEITVPTEIIHGEKDTTVPVAVHAAPLSNQIKNANLTVLEGAGHMPHHSREADVIAAIDRATKRAGLR